MKILDFEASGLDPQSYPIQVAWVDIETSAYDVFYIKPHDTWDFWDTNAQDIHNIPREKLFSEGLSVEEAALRLYRTMVCDEYVVSDAPFYELFWFTRLFEVVSCPKPKFEFIHPLAISNVDAVELIPALSEQLRMHDALSDCRMIKEAILKSQNKNQ